MTVEFGNIIKNVISIYVHDVITAVHPLLYAMFVMPSELGHDGKTKKRKKGLCEILYGRLDRI